MEDLSGWVARARRGDSTAYEQIVHCFQDMAVGYAYSLIGDWQQAEDIAQEAFISAYYTLPQLRDVAAFPGWFRRIVFTQANRSYRKKQPVLVPLDHAVSVALSETSSVLEQRETRDEIYAAIHALPEHQRSVVMLFYMSDYSQKEIADFLEIPVATIKTRLHYARKQLKERIFTLDNLESQRPSRDNRFSEKVMHLFDATKNGDYDAVKNMLADDRSLAQASGFIQTSVWGSDAHALHVAVMHGRKDIVDLLLANGADINARDEKYYFTALIHAIDLAAFMPDYAELGMVDFLLERGAEKDIWACWWMGDREGTKAWLDKDPSLVNQIGPGRSTLLFYTQDLEAIDFLLAYGADPLLKIDAPNWWGTLSPLQEMALRGQFDAVRHLLKHTGIEVDVFWASILGDTQAIQSMIDAEPQLVRGVSGEDHVLGAGWTALHLAAQAGHTELVTWLHSKGADISARGPKNFTPLHLVISFGPKQLFDPLPDVEQSAQGAGVYHLLTDMPQLLIDLGADLTARENEHHLTPLGLATSQFEDETDRREVIDLLEKEGAGL